MLQLHSAARHFTLNWVGGGISAKRRSVVLTLWLHVPVVALVTIASGYIALRETPLTYSVHFLGAISFCLAGVLLANEPRRRAFGLSLIISSYLLATRWVMAWDWGPLPYLGVQAEIWFYSYTGSNVLRYLDRGKISRLDKATIGALLLIAILRGLIPLISQPEWLGFNPDSWWITAVALENQFPEVLRGLYVLDVVASLLFATSMFRRLSAIKGIDQIFSIPLAAGFSSIGLIAAGTQSTANVLPSPSMNDYYVVASMVVLLLPASLIVALFRRNSKHASIANTLHARFLEQAPTLESVREALRQTLQDPYLNVAYWDQHVQSALSEPAADSFVRLVHDRMGNPLALVTADPALNRHVEVANTAVNASAIALENARLHDTVQQQLAEVESSRARIAEAALEERRRIERDLHDGVQQRLLALGTRIGAAKQRADGEMRETLVNLNEDLRTTLDSLRELARGIHPTELRQFGLMSAVSDAAQHLPVATCVEIPDKRYSPAVEATAYFVICEALANVVKHARAANARVRVTESHGGLELIVRDDGVGGASFDGGTGLVGLRDRVAALGGWLAIRTDDDGTVVMARVPI